MLESVDFLGLPEFVPCPSFPGNNENLDFLDSPDFFECPVLRSNPESAVFPEDPGNPEYAIFIWFYTVLYMILFCFFIRFYMVFM